MWAAVVPLSLSHGGERGRRRIAQKGVDCFFLVYHLDLHVREFKGVDAVSAIASVVHINAETVKADDAVKHVKIFKTGSARVGLKGRSTLWTSLAQERRGTKTTSNRFNRVRWCRKQCTAGI